MFGFQNGENGVSLYAGKMPVLTGITPWYNSRLIPWEDKNDLIVLSLTECNEKTASFTDETGKLSLVLSLKEDNNCFGIFAEGTYLPTLGHGTHLNDYYGLGFDFDTVHKGGMIDCFIDWLYWQRPAFIGDCSELRDRTQALLFRRENGERGYFMTVSHLDFKSELCANAGRARLVAHSNTVRDEINECIFIGGIGNDEYELTERTAEFGLKVMKKPGKLRREKKYPEIFEYLGWCSWDAFHMDVTDQNLYDKSAEFKEKNIPVRWMIIDDMWGDVSAIDRKTMHTREINDWEADPIRFPHGLKETVSEIKNRYGIKVGIWHPTCGYWYGVNPNGALARRYPELFEYTIPGMWPFGSFLMHSFDKKKVEKYYGLEHEFYQSCGIDFAKIDNQGSTERLCHNKGTIGVCASNLHRAIEKAVKKNYKDGALINCMGMPVENFWNRGDSAVCRFSDDFQPENRKWFIQHLLQCSYNSLTQGALFVGDWDMWWSDDAQASKNAVLRSMSGGPVYMSDELGRSVREVILPLVFSDGRIVRLKQGALPARECIFENNEENGKIYKVFNRIKDGGVIAAFNTDKEERPVSGTVSPADLGNIKSGSYAVYDWFNKTVTVLTESDRQKLVLQNYDDFRLYLIVPIHKGRAVIGLAEKYMATAAVEQSGSSIKALDDGTLLIYAEKKPDGFTDLGDKLFSKAVHRDEVIRL